MSIVFKPEYSKKKLINSKYVYFESFNYQRSHRLHVEEACDI